MIKKIFVIVILLVGSILGFGQEKNVSLKSSLFDKATYKSEIIKVDISKRERDEYLEHKKLPCYFSQEKNSNPSAIHTFNIQNPLASDPCFNTDFEEETFYTWEADTGFIDYWTKTATYFSGFSNAGNNASLSNPLARHTIMTIKPAITTLPIPTPYTGYDSMLVFIDKKTPIDSAVTHIAPNGGNISVRLGNAVPNYGTERLKKTFVVDNNSSAFTYSYAAILEKPGPLSPPHDSLERPRFTCRLLDQNGNQLSGPCSAYEVYSGKDTSFIDYFDSTTFTYYNYKPWTTVGIDLSPYVGQILTLEFTTRDCSQGGHFGYAYIDAKCTTFDIKSSFCPGEKKVKLTAPAGYVSYLWKDPAGNVIGNQQSVEVNSPKLGDVYTVQIVSVTGCQSLLKSIIERAPPPIMPSYEITQNIITPNGDGKNDLFKTNQFDYIGSFNIEIYNRWGLKVFESSDPTKEWDGKNNGKDVDDGIYYWIARYQSTCFEDPKDVLSKGFVHVLR